MSSTAVLVVDHILRDAEHQHALDFGKRLYLGLSSVMGVALIAEKMTESQYDYFMKIEGLKKPPYVFTSEDRFSPDPIEQRKAQLAKLRRLGCHIDFVIEPDGHVAVELITAGYKVLSFIQPLYSRSDFRPDYRSETMPWDQLVAELEQQRLLKASDPRTKAE